MRSHIQDLAAEMLGLASSSPCLRVEWLDLRGQICAGLRAPSPAVSVALVPRSEFGSLDDGASSRRQDGQEPWGKEPQAKPLETATATTETETETTTETRREKHLQALGSPDCGLEA